MAWSRAEIKPNVGLVIADKEDKRRTCLNRGLFQDMHAAESVVQEADGSAQAVQARQVALRVRRQRVDHRAHSRDGPQLLHAKDECSRPLLWRTCACGAGTDAT